MYPSQRTSDLHREVAHSNGNPASLISWFEKQLEKNERQALLRAAGKTVDEDEPEHARRPIPRTEASALAIWSHALNLRADNGVAQHRGDTALIIAIKKLQEPLVKVLLDYGVSPNAHDLNYHRLTPIMHCVQRPSFTQPCENILKMLLEGGARVTATCADRARTALHFAVEKNHLMAVAMLLEYGADLWAADRNGETPIHLAMRQQRSSAVAQTLWDYSQEHYPDHILRVCHQAKTITGTLAASMLTTMRQRTGSDWAFARNFAQSFPTAKECHAEHLRLEEERRNEMHLKGPALPPVKSGAFGADQVQQPLSPSASVAAAATMEEMRATSTKVFTAAALASFCMLALPLLMKIR